MRNFQLVVRDGQTVADYKFFDRTDNREHYVEHYKIARGDFAQGLWTMDALSETAAIELAQDFNAFLLADYDKQRAWIARHNDPILTAAFDARPAPALVDVVYFYSFGNQCQSAQVLP